MQRHLIPPGDSGHIQSPDCPCFPSPKKGTYYEVYIHTPMTIVKDTLLKIEELLRPMMTQDIAIEIFLGHRCADCYKYINEKGEHVSPPVPVDETSST